MVKIWQARSHRICNASPLVYSLLRGAVMGFLIWVVFNHTKWGCKSKYLEDQELEVVIPENYRANSPSPRPPISGEHIYTQQPTKILRELKENPDRRYYITFVVQVATLDAKRRFYSRITWGSVAEIDGKRIAVIFVIGKGLNKVQDKLLGIENDLYGDILQTNVHPSMKNGSTLRVLSGYQWAIENIKDRGDYFVSVQGDMFVDLPNIFEYCMKIDDSDQKDTFHCGIHISPSHYKVKNPMSQFYVPYKEYAHPVYPAYCDSDIVLTSHQVTKKLYETAKVTYLGPFPFESVYTWGILREKMRHEGETNILLAKEFIKNQDLLPLGYQIDYTAFRSAENRNNFYWNATRDRFIFDSDVGQKRSDKDNKVPRRTVRLAKIPTTSEKSTPEKDMKVFVTRWNRLPRTKNDR